MLVMLKGFQFLEALKEFDQWSIKIEILLEWDCIYKHH